MVQMGSNLAISTESLKDHSVSVPLRSYPEEIFRGAFRGWTPALLTVPPALAPAQVWASPQTTLPEAHWACLRVWISHLSSKAPL